MAEHIDLTPKPNPLTEFLQRAMPVKAKPEPEGVAREAARQEALKARGERLEHWRRYAAQAREPMPDNLATGTNHKAIRETASLSVGDTADILGVSPADVESYERGQRTYADERFKQFAATMRDAILEQSDGAA